ncbi:MAG: hypothetical protein R2831_09560 [Chitinophagaceae bacterium]
MRFHSILFIGIFCSFLSFAQNKYKPVTLVGAQSQFMMPIKKSNQTRFKMGIPSFSYGASVENRFSLHTHLNFSFLYSLNYFHFLPNTSQSSQQVQGSVGFQAYKNICSKSAFYSGMQLCMPIYDVGKRSLMLNKAAVKNNKILLNPSVSLGIERTIELSHKSLFYYFQYNIGFNPQQFTNTESADQQASYYQGLQIGVKYKY